MKKFLFILVFSSVSFIVNISAQGVSKLFGLVGGTPQGDQSSNGYLFSTDSSGTNFQVQYSFPVITFGANPANVELALYNGKLYGTTYQGGTGSYGTIFEYDPVTNIYTKKFDFGANITLYGYNPKGSLLLYNGKFYGLAQSGGTNFAGTIFEWDPATNIFTKKYNFIGSGGSGPQNSLRLLNNKMYGTTLQGGSSNVGVVFQWDPATNIYTDLLDLTGSGAGNGSNFNSNVTVYNNKLYCMSQQGATNNYGALYAIDPSLPNGSNTTIIKVFDGTTGGNANNNEMMVYNNKLYGCLYSAGSNNSGTLFQLDPATNIFTKLVDFNYTPTGRGPLGRLVLNGTKFLGMCNDGGANATGTIYEWDPANPTTVVKKYDFGANNFDNPIQPGIAMFLYNGKYYGTTYNGGFVDQGTLFAYDYTANTVAKKLNFNAAENGRIPYGQPTLLNGKIYGTCYTGPQEIFGAPYGTIWEFDPSTSIYSRKFLFSNVNSGANGRRPISSPVAYNGKLYGTTANGGISDWGVLYEFDPATNAFAKKDFQPLGGAFPAGEPVVFNNKLYGMTYAGGIGNNGIIYSFDPATQVLSKLYDVQNVGSNKPNAGFVVYNNKLYSTTSDGGANNSGAVFSFDPATNIATSLADLSSSIGVTVQNAMTVYNSKMYNTALSGGSGGRGTIFSFDPATNSLNNLYSFPNSAGGNGYNPQGRLTINGNKMYTTTQESGGITRVVEFDPATNAVTAKSSNTSTNTNLIVARNGLTVVPAFIANGQPNSCEAYPIVVINGSNNNKWVPILNSAGDVVAEIKGNGNNLGNVNASVYINSAIVREDPKHQLYLDRNITITVQNQPTSNVDIRLYIKTNEYLSLKNAFNSQSQPSGIVTINDIAIFKNEQGCSASITANASKLTTTASLYEYGYVLSASVGSFSSFYFAKNSFTILPVNLLSFNAVKEKDKVALYWNTANEINLQQYEVEKSTDGLNYSKITAQLAKGNTSNTYTATDRIPIKGFNYYRLKMIDKDRRFNYSNIVRVDFSVIEKISISPVPAKDYIIVNGTDNFNHLQITDITGKRVRTINKNSTNRYSLAGLINGIYFVRLSGGENAETIKIVIQ